jgi:hypothetical protein
VIGIEGTNGQSLNFPVNCSLIWPILFDPKPRLQYSFHGFHSRCLQDLIDGFISSHDSKRDTIEARADNSDRESNETKENLTDNGGDHSQTGRGIHSHEVASRPTIHN